MFIVRRLPLVDIKDKNARETTSFPFLIPHSFSTIPVGGGQAGALP